MAASQHHPVFEHVPVAQVKPEGIGLRFDP